MGDAAAPAGFSTIEELAARVGHYCWAEQRVFELAGEWASAPRPGDAGTGPDPEVRVWCAAASRRHGDLALRWRGRLPVRAGVDAGALVVAPDGPLADVFDTLAAESDPVLGPAGLILVVLPTLFEAYGRHLVSAAPVREAPVMEVLAAARDAAGAEIPSGKSMLQRVGGTPGAAGAPGGGGRLILEQLQRMFGTVGDVFPVVRPA